MLAVSLPLGHLGGDFLLPPTPSGGWDLRDIPPDQYGLWAGTGSGTTQADANASVRANATNFSRIEPEALRLWGDHN